MISKSLSRGVCRHTVIHSINRSVFINTVFQGLMIPSWHYHYRQHRTFTFWAPDTLGTEHKKKRLHSFHGSHKGKCAVCTAAEVAIGKRQRLAQPRSATGFPENDLNVFRFFCSCTKTKAMIYRALLSFLRHETILDIASAFPSHEKHTYPEQ